MDLADQQFSAGEVLSPRELWKSPGALLMVTYGRMALTFSGWRPEILDVLLCVG